MFGSNLRIFILLLVVHVTVSLPLLAMAAHPAEGGTPQDISNWYQNCPGPDENYGEITFVAGDDKPALSSLTDMERYMVGGMKRTTRGTSMQPWVMNVYLAACKYYKQFGIFPQELNYDMLNSITDYDWMTDAQLEVFKNPLTGQWPRFDSVNFTPGGIYLRPLSDDELRHYAELHSYYKQVWFDNIGTDWDALLNGYSYDCVQTKPVRLMGPVCYLLAYGLNGTLTTTFVYATK